ncbi:hypothetical protein E3O19_08775 [Cryobacterium algoritolerans]|uniref:AbiTii domain-containing protein n=1 Tax=Cryobacterium algoritolerans TaxID=1259184 RepID=A0A4R8WV10_9MICO|nr:hypothetical protein [Cryobacterium algoritolerans]TFC15213.1 hypothetical protein E3O19_08775 [Cryobacterium algoritolerans]
MSDTLLHSLREQVLDESQPLAGLLRKCLMLGAETGSSALRNWARYELNGYGDDVDVPSYRRLSSPAIRMDTISGNMHVKGQTIHRLQLPVKAQEVVSEWIYLRQPIEELETLTGEKSLSFTNAGLAYAQTIWNGQLEMFQQIMNMYFDLPSSAIVGVLGQIRTQLVDVIADLMADTPLTDLPRKDQVDAAVGQRIGTQYLMTINTAHGPTAIGARAEATVHSFSIDDAIKLLDTVRAASDGVRNEVLRTELLDALEDLRTEAQKDELDTVAVHRKTGRLRAAATRIGVPTITAAVGGAVEAFTSLAMTNTFG